MQNIALIFDTNVLLDQNEVLQELFLSIAKLNIFLIVPWQVLQELDGLKNGASLLNPASGGDLSYKARNALRWIQNNAQCPNLHIQNSEQTHLPQLSSSSIKDDRILDCCLFFKSSFRCIFLLTNDRNLGLKAISHDIFVIADWDGQLAALIETIQANFISSGKPNIIQDHDGDAVMLESQVTEDQEVVKSQHTAKTLANVIEEFSRALGSSIDACFVKYLGQEWEFVVVKRSKPYSTKDILFYLDKYWKSVFSNILPKGTGRKISSSNELYRKFERKAISRFEEHDLIENLEEIQTLFGKTPSLSLS